jgi:NAD+ synthase (glutamine-hydrolysing)
MNGGLSVIGDVYKTQVYELANYINRHEELIPENIATQNRCWKIYSQNNDNGHMP